MIPRSLLGMAFIAGHALVAIEFEPNMGQIARHYEFAAKSPLGEIFGETGGDLVYRTRHGERVTLSWLRGKPGKWQAEHPTSRRVRYCVAGASVDSCENGSVTSKRMRRPGLYEGIDLVLHGTNGSFEYDLELQPNARLEDVRFQLLGATLPQLDVQGRIVAGNIVQWRPIAWQTEGDTRHPVDCEVRQFSERVFGFVVKGGYRKDLPLVIDPVIESARVIIGPERGEDKILGRAGESTFGVSRRAGSDNWDIFVSYGGGWQTTYWGGEGDETLLGFTPVSNSQLLILTGSTASRNALQIGPGFRSSYQGGPTDGFFLVVAEAIIYKAAVLGGPGADRIHGAMDTPLVIGNMNAVFFGETSDPNWSGYSVSGEARGGTDAIAVAYTGSAGSIHVIGGSGDDRALMIRAVDATPPYLVLAGETESPDFPGKSTPDKDLWFARFTNTPLRIETPKTWGGERDESLAGFGVIDGHGLLLAGTTNSTRLPSVAADQPGFNGGASDGFAAWLDPRDFTPIQARFLGGPAADGILAMAVRQNDLYLAGFTDSTTLALPALLPGSDPAGLEDGLFIQTDALLNPLTVYRAGGSGNERFTSVQPRELGRVDLTGWSESRPWLASLEASSAASDTVAGFSYSLRYAATSLAEYSSRLLPPVLTLGRDLFLDVVVTAQNEPGSDGIVIVRSLDPSKLRISGEEAALISRAGTAGAPAVVRLEALAGEGEVDVLISGRTPSATSVRYQERRLRVRLVPSAVFFPGLPGETVNVRRGFDFSVPYVIAQVLPNGEAGTPRNVRPGVDAAVRIQSSDLTIVDPNGAAP